MYLSEKDVKALKILLKTNTTVRGTGRSARARKQLVNALIKNSRRLQQQRKMIAKATQMPTKYKNNSWD